MTIVCFEDDRVQQLYPITLARPAYAITCAGFRLVSWLRDASTSIAGHVRPHLQTFQELDFGIDEYSPASVDPSSASDGLLLVNARIAPTVRSGELIERLSKSADSGVIVDPEDQSVLVAKFTSKDLGEMVDQATDASTHPLDFESLMQAVVDQPAIDESIDVFRWPHDVVQTHMAEMETSMNARVRLGNYSETADGVFVGQNVRIGDYAVIDTSDGPIVFEDNVQVGPFAYLAGPIYAGKGTRVIEHSALKDGVSLGHTTKIGGEIEASVIEPYTNKQHHGFLGHSYLGSWINLGAGTCNSDLKNTYGKINITYGEQKVATEMQFLGCFIGDYSKTAINTSIFTGKVIGVCSMMYGFVTSNVPSYVNYARLFGQTSLLPPDVMISTQKRMFARRKVEQRDCDKQLMRDMYHLTLEERGADPDLL